MTEGSSAREAPAPNRTLTGPLILALLSIILLSLLHVVLVILWASHTLDKHDFSLSKLGMVSQLTAVSSQACTVGLLSMLSFAVQTIAAEKFIRHRECIL